ncbi:MAG TPA: hypothetical protein VI462_17460 [Acidimicrobiia bacterium]
MQPVLGTDDGERAGAHVTGEERLGLQRGYGLLDVGDDRRLQQL